MFDHTSQHFHNLILHTEIQKILINVFNFCILYLPVNNASKSVGDILHSKESAPTLVSPGDTIATIGPKGERRNVIIMIMVTMITI